MDEIYFDDYKSYLNDTGEYNPDDFESDYWEDISPDIDRIADDFERHMEALEIADGNEELARYIYEANPTASQLDNLMLYGSFEKYNMNQSGFHIAELDDDEDDDYIDSTGYDAKSYDKDGYDRDGYDRAGYDRNGYNKNGLDRNGLDKSGNRPTKRNPYLSRQIKREISED